LEIWVQIFWGPARLKFMCALLNVISDNFRLRARISRERINTAKIGEASDQLQPLPCKRQTLNKSHTDPPKINFFRRPYFGPLGVLPYQLLTCNIECPRLANVHDIRDRGP